MHQQNPWISRLAMASAAAAAFLQPGAAWSVDLAKVNGKVITDKDLQGALGSLNDGQRESVLRDQNTRRQVLDSVIEQELLAQEGEKQKLEDAEYKEALAAFRKQFLANRVLQKNVAAKLSDAAAKKYYENHKTRYSTDQVHAQHILVSDESKARDLIKKAREKDVDFQKLAEENSKDPSAKNNRGDLGFFGRDRMVPEFTEAAFGGKAGEIVGPVKTTYGYHVIKIIERKTGATLGYDEVELRVKNQLRQELADSFLSGLRKQAKIEIDDKALTKF